jgi:hypothetical protein
MVTRELTCGTINTGRIGDVQLDRRHAAICGVDLIEIATPTAQDDHLVVQRWKGSANPQPPPVMKMVLSESFMTSSP